MIEVILYLVSFGCGVGAAFLAFAKYHRCPELPIVVPPIDPFPDSRFKVVFKSDDGASARKLYEVADAKGMGKIEFWDGPDCRGVK